MSGIRAVFNGKWGLRQSLGLGIIGAALLLSFLLVSCGNDQPAPANGSDRVNLPANQATVQTTTVPPTAAPATSLVVVAARPIPAGSILTPSDLTQVSKPRSEIIADQDILDFNDAVNKINRVSYNTGQQLKRGELVEGSFSNYMRQLVTEKRLEPGKKAFPYATNDLSAVQGLIQENDLVDIVATYVVERRINAPVGAQATNTTNGIVIQAQTNPGLELTTKTILQNVRVLKVVRLQTRTVDVAARATATPNPDTPTAVVAVQSTPTPTPTLQALFESGAGFEVNTVLILGVTDQEAEVLKFTREYRISGTAGRLSANNPSVGVTDTSLTSFLDSNVAAPRGIPVVHFALRAKPQDPANPVDAALSRETTSGVTFRILVRDYGLPIPELIFVSGTQ